MSIINQFIIAFVLIIVALGLLGNVDHEDDGGNYDGHYTSGDHENVEYADDGGSSAESGHYTAENEEDDGDY